MINEIISCGRHNEEVWGLYLNHQEPLKYIPHQPPWLLIDGVTELTETSIVAYTTVTYQHCKGHFVGHPIMPGVLILEAIAQAAGILASFKNEDQELVYLLAGIRKAQFRRPVVPGDRLDIEVILKQKKNHFSQCTARVAVNQKIVCVAELLGSGQKLAHLVSPA
jgi:3-hydroxyacyl-[acyl-carrier-protein] dehydratase